MKKTGGQKNGEKTLQVAEDAMVVGAAGISFGRNVFNRTHKHNYLVALKEIILNKSTAEKAFEIYKNL